VLDVACGEGYGAAHLAEVASSVTGIDIDAETIEHARAAHPRDNLRFVEGSVDALPIDEDRAFDLVTSFETIEHVDEPSQLAFVREVRRVLRDDGVFVVSSPDRRTYSDERASRNPYHVRELDLDELHDVLRPHFRHIAFLKQGVHGVSYIHPIEPSDAPVLQVGAKTLTAARFEADDSAPPHLYFLAICSNKPVSAPHSLLWERSEGLLHENAIPMVAELTRVAAQLEETREILEQRDRDVEELQARLAEMRSTVATMAAAPAWRATRALEGVAARLSALRGKRRG